MVLAQLRGLRNDVPVLIKNMGFTGELKNKSAQVVPGEGKSHKARLRRKKNELAEEARAIVEAEETKKGGVPGESFHSRRDMYIDRIRGESTHLFDWMKCRMNPSEENACRIPDITTTSETSVNHFYANGTITSSDAGNFYGRVHPYLVGCMFLSSISPAAGALTDLGLPTAAGSAWRYFPETNAYGANCPYTRCVGYAVTFRFLGNLTNTQGQFVICDPPPGSNLTTFAAMTAVPGAHFGAVTELFQKGTYHWYGEFASTQQGLHAGSDSSVLAFEDTSVTEFHKFDQTAYPLAGGGNPQVPQISFAFQGLTVLSDEIAIEVNMVYEGIPVTRLIPRGFGHRSDKAMAVGGLASHPVIKHMATGSTKFHKRSSDGLSTINTFWNDSKKAANWIIGNVDKLGSVGSDVLSAAGMVAGFLPLLL